METKKQQQQQQQQKQQQQQQQQRLSQDISSSIFTLSQTRNKSPIFETRFFFCWDNSNEIDGEQTGLDGTYHIIM